MDNLAAIAGYAHSRNIARSDLDSSTLHPPEGLFPSPRVIQNTPSGFHRTLLFGLPR